MKTRSTGLAALGALATAILLASCGGTSDSSSSSSGVQLTGLAATGAALSAATVNVKCQFGLGTATTAADGSFTVQMSAPAQAPCLLQVTKGSTTIYGLANANGRVNVTPLTDLLVSHAAGGDPGTAFTNFDPDRAASIRARLDAARTFVQTQVAALGGNVITGDPLTKAFVIGDADDKILDNLAATLAAAGKTLGDLRTAAAAGTDLRAALPAEETRPHDTIAYALNATDAAATTFAAMAAATSPADVVDMSTTDRWAGVLKGSGYRIEVPKNWNGELVMYTHGFAGEGLVLNAVSSSIRRFLIQNGYAWAASSYSKNSYDVKAGIEDTNLLANSFASISDARGRKLATPSRFWIIGHSMGGHIAAAAVEAETYATSVNKVKYAGSMPMCGVVGDTTLFDTFAGMQAAAHVLGGKPTLPLDQWLVGTNKPEITAALFGTTLGTSQVVPNGAAGQKYMSVLQNLTGGARPLFDVGYTFGGSFAGGPYGVFGTTTVSSGLTTKPTADTGAIVYKVDSDTATSDTLNSTAPKAVAPADANRLRRDGLRWIPKVNGQLQTPVLTLHTLGDLFVPFSMEQVYRKRADANGSGSLLVQRAIRGATHCDFTNAEMQKGFTDLVAWVKNGTKPAGDDVTTAATVAATKYGCQFTDDTLHSVDEASGTTKALRGLITSLQKNCAALPN